MKWFGELTLWIACMTIPVAPSWAAWPLDPSSNVPVDTLGGGGPIVVSDGTGGILVAWVGDRNGTSMVMAQHFDSGGQPLWSANGMFVAPAGPPGQTVPRMVSDGEGGAFVTWIGNRAGSADDVFAQRLSGSGVLRWGTAGVTVSGAAGNQYEPELVADGAGGVIVAWRGGGLFAQRLDGDGSPQWATNGVAFGQVNALAPQLIRDGAGGAIVTWFGSATFDYYADDIYAQRVSAAGALVWGTGVNVCSAAGHQGYPVLVPDGFGGAIIAWEDARSGQNWADCLDVYAQRVDALGVALWAPGGVGVCTAIGWQSGPKMVEDGVGGAILVWNDNRGDSTHVYAQRVDGSGTGQWGANGIGLFTVDGAQILPALAADGEGGAVVVWMDHRSGEFQTYGQRLSISGEPVWSPGGLALSTATARQESPHVVWDGANGGVVVWADYRDTTTCEVFAQGLRGSGLGEGPVASTEPGKVSADVLAPASANPSRGGGMWVRATLRGSEKASIDVLDVAGRRMLSRTLDGFGPGAHVIELLRGVRIAGGVYLVRLRQGDRVHTIRLARLD